MQVTHRKGVVFLVIFAKYAFYGIGDPRARFFTPDQLLLESKRWQGIIGSVYERAKGMYK